EDGIRDFHVTGVQTCALPIFNERLSAVWTASREEIEEAGNLSSAMDALLAEFVLALKGAEDARMAGVSVAEDKAAKRASQLADRSEERRVGKEGVGRWGEIRW